MMAKRDTEQGVSFDSTRRRTRLRAVSLAVVWSLLPGIWCAMHLLAHELEAGHHEHSDTTSPGDRIADLSGDHDHSHAHPDSDPAIAPDLAKKLNPPALLIASARLDSSEPSDSLREGNADETGTPCACAVSAPRAPPIS